MTALGKKLALTAIIGYQRFLSPLKGYGCTYRIYGGGQSCSAYAHRAIARHGVVIGLALLRRRLDACERHYLRHARPSGQLGTGMVVRQQGGFCDAPSCDVPCSDLAAFQDCGPGKDALELLGDALDVIDCCNQCRSCHWPASSRRVSDPPERPVP